MANGVRAAAMLAALGLSGCTSPWRELETRFSVKAAAPANAETGKKISLMATGYRGSFTYAGMVTQAFGNDRVFLSLARRVGEPSSVSIPISAIKACSRTQWSPGWDTNLWLAEARVDISFPDNSGRVFEWCKARQLSVVARPDVYRALFPNPEKGGWGTR